MRQRSEYTKITIIAMAKELFMDIGYSSTSIDAIAEKSGVTKKTIYNYFVDKRTLFGAVIDDSVDSTHTLPESLEINTIGDLQKSLFLMARSLNEIIVDSDYVNLQRVVVSEIKNQPDLSIILEKGIVSKAMNRVSDILITASSKGLIKVNNVDFCVRMFMGHFLASLLLDGLLDPSYIKLRKSSQADLILYVNSFINKLIMDNYTTGTKTQLYASAPILMGCLMENITIL
jgi:AcrR family transcriptional regulator